MENDVLRSIDIDVLRSGVIDVVRFGVLQVWGVLLEKVLLWFCCGGLLVEFEREVMIWKGVLDHSDSVLDPSNIVLDSPAMITHAQPPPLNNTRE